MGVLETTEKVWMDSETWRVSPLQGFTEQLSKAWAHGLSGAAVRQSHVHTFAATLGAVR